MSRVFVWGVVLIVDLLVQLRTLFVECCTLMEWTSNCFAIKWNVYRIKLRVRSSDCCFATESSIIYMAIGHILYLFNLGLWDGITIFMLLSRAWSLGRTRFPFLQHHSTILVCPYSQNIDSLINVVLTFGIYGFSTILW